MQQRYSIGTRFIPEPTSIPENDNSPQVNPALTTPPPGWDPTPAIERVVSIFDRVFARGALFVPAHFFHNILVTSAIFPASFQFSDLEHSVKQPGSIWDTAWTGQFDPGSAIVLFIYLIFISIGFAAAWKRWRWAGTIPAIIYLAYNMATAAARTSGARYIQPADWIALFYLAIGLVQGWQWLRTVFISELSDIHTDEPHDSAKQINPPARFWKIILTSGVAILISGLVVMTEWIFPLRYPKITPSALAAELEKQNLVSQLDLKPGEIQTFLHNENAVLLRGRAIYPRYYGIGTGEPDHVSAYRGQDFPRLVVTTVGQDDIQFGVLPLAASPEFFLSGSDVILLGCRSEFNIDLAAIIMTGPVEQVIKRSPERPLTCPMPAPVCDNNRICR